MGISKDERPRFVLVTGASSGIGAAIVRTLSQNGFDVIPTFRDITQSDPATAPKTFPIELDVTNESSINRAFVAVEKIVGQSGLFAIVNNAAVLFTGPLEAQPIPLLRQQLETNVVGVVAVTQAFLPLIRQRVGRIVNIGSGFGRLSAPLFGSYSASKFAIEAVSDALRVELSPWQIRVTIVDPGSVRTPIWIKNRESHLLLENGLSDVMRERYRLALDAVACNGAKAEKFGMEPERVASAVLKVITSRNPKSRVFVGADAAMANLLSRFLPIGILDMIVTVYFGISKWHQVTIRSQKGRSAST